VVILRLSSKPSDQGITESKVGKIDKSHIIIEFSGQIEELIAHFAELGYLITGKIDYAIEQIMNDLNNIRLEMMTPGIENLTRFNVEWMEQNVEQFKSHIKIKNEGLPFANNLSAAKANIIKCKVRQAERCFYRLIKDVPVNELIGKYLNHLDHYMELLYLLLNVVHKNIVEKEEKR